jgi:hypothetical protein
VACFRPFLEYLVGSDLSPKTIQRHVDHVSTLGGEIIRNVNEEPSLKRKTSSRSSMTGSMRRVGRSSMPWNRKSPYSAPSIPPAGNSTASSDNRLAEPGQITRRFRRLGRVFTPDSQWTLVRHGDSKEDGDFGFFGFVFSTEDEWGYFGRHGYGGSLNLTKSSQTPHRSRNNARL